MHTEAEKGGPKRQRKLLFKGEALWLLSGQTVRKSISYHSVQFSSVTQSCLTLCDPMDHSTPGLPVYHQLQEFAKFMSIESVMPSNHLILCPPFCSCPQSFPASGTFQMSSLHQVAKVLEFQLQHQSFQ